MNYKPIPPVRFCANCGRHCGRSWKPFIKCRTCLKEGLERVEREPIGNVDNRMKEIRKDRDDNRRKQDNEIPY